MLIDHGGPLLGNFDDFLYDRKIIHSSLPKHYILTPEFLDYISRPKWRRWPKKIPKRLRTLETIEFCGFDKKASKEIWETFSAQVERFGNGRFTSCSSCANNPLELFFADERAARIRCDSNYKVPIPGLPEDLIKVFLSPSCNPFVSLMLTHLLPSEDDLGQDRLSEWGGFLCRKGLAAPILHTLALPGFREQLAEKSKGIGAISWAIREIYDRYHFLERIWLDEYRFSRRKRRERSGWTWFEKTNLNSKEKRAARKRNREWQKGEVGRQREAIIFEMEEYHSCDMCEIQDCLGLALAHLPSESDEDAGKVLPRRSLCRPRKAGRAGHR